MIHTVSTGEKSLNPKIHGAISHGSKTEAQNGPFLRLIFPVYRPFRSPYSWQAFRQQEKRDFRRITHNLSKSESALHVRSPLSAMFREAHRESANSERSQAIVHGLLALRILVRPGSRPRVDAEAA